jgi:hypothetical protein
MQRQRLEDHREGRSGSLSYRVGDYTIRRVDMAWHVFGPRFQTLKTAIMWCRRQSAVDAKADAKIREARAQ